MVDDIKLPRFSIHMPVGEVFELGLNRSRLLDCTVGRDPAALSSAELQLRRADCALRRVQSALRHQKGSPKRALLNLKNGCRTRTRT